MKNFGCLLGVLIASACCLRAQVTVEVVLEQEQFLPGEALPVAVRITNRSGQTLRFGRDEDWLTFAVESRDGFVATKLEEVPVIGEFELESSKRATKRVDLAPYFNLGKPGRYAIVATVNIREWNQQVSAPPKPFDIINGAKLWEREFGVPRAPGSTETPEVRKYVLQQANYLRTQLKLYVRLTDLSGTKVYKVFPIGPMVSFGQPEPQVDKFSNLHVLYQTGPRSFTYTIIDPDGEVIGRQRHEITSTRPRLWSDKEGKFQVVGGARRFSADDLPATRLAEPETNAP